MSPCLIGLILLSAVFSGIIGATDLNETITVIPTVVVALINDSTFFNCSTTSVEVEWLLESDRYEELFIYTHGTVQVRYVYRFRVQNYTNSFGNHYNLILENVTMNDAGVYICRVPNSEEGKMVHLTVIEAYPVCKSNFSVHGLIKQNNCSIKPDTVQLSCSVIYNGNQVPELQWTKMGENMTINSSICSDSGNVYTCNLTIETELQMEGDSYICQTTQTRTNQYNCTSDVFGIIYVLREETKPTTTVDDKINCSMNSSSRSCNFSWIFDNGTTNWTESQESIIEFKRPGRFICQTVCVIRNDSCTFTATTMTVNDSVSASPQDTDNTTSKINVGAVGGGVVGAAVVFLGIVVGLIFFCRRKKKRQQRRNEPDGTELPMLSDLERNGGTADDDIIPRKFGPKADENKNNDRRVRGLTILNDELFVAYFTSNIIEALPIPSCTQYRKVVVNGLKDPGTMAACATNSCLYVIDKIASSNKKIFKFKPDGEVIREWNTDDDDYGRISVSDDGNVIMTDYRKHKLKIYSSDGDLLPERTIDFTKFSGTKIDYLFHAIDVTDGRFIISHGSYQSDVHRVCKIDAKGNLLLSFGNEIGSDEAQLNFPAYLAKRQNGSILVADQNNDRIILLSSDLTFKTVLFTKEKDDVILPDVMQIYEKTEPPLLFLGCNETVMSGGYVVVLSLE